MCHREVPRSDQPRPAQSVVGQGEGQWSCLNEGRAPARWLRTIRVDGAALIRQQVADPQMDEGTEPGGKTGTETRHRWEQSLLPLGWVCELRKWPAVAG